MQSMIESALDKENTTSGIFRTKQFSQPIRAAPKIFQDPNLTKSAQRLGARKALGNVNRDLSTPLRPSNVIKKPSNGLASCGKSVSKAPQKMVEAKTTVKHVSKSLIDKNAEIEKIYIYEEPEDDYEDLWPAEERLSSYLTQLVSFRPRVREDLDNKMHELEVPETNDFDLQLNLLSLQPEILGEEVPNISLDADLFD